MKRVLQNKVCFKNETMHLHRHIHHPPFQESLPFYFNGEWFLYTPTMLSNKIVYLVDIMFADCMYVHVMYEAI